MNGPIEYSHPEPGIARVLLNRPDVHNALDGEAVRLLREHIGNAVARDSARVVVLGSATPGRFCGGADLSVSDDERRSVSDELYALYEQMITLEVPIVVAVDGPAVGGGAQLVLTGDVRLGSSRARLRFAGPGHGLSVGVWALPSTVGRRALELVLSQRFVPGEEAVALGLLDRVTDDPLGAAMELARTVTGLEPDAVRRAKTQVVRGERLVERLADERAGNTAVFSGAVPE